MASEKTVTVACKLPHGLDLGNGVVLKGSHSQGAVGGYGLTENVNADVFGQWVKDHKGHFRALDRGLIFAADSTDRAVAQAREQAGIRSGFEPLDPNKPAPGIEPTDETKKELAKTDPRVNPV